MNIGKYHQEICLLKDNKDQVNKYVWSGYINWGNEAQKVNKSNFNADFELCFNPKEFLLYDCPKDDYQAELELQDSFPLTAPGGMHPYSHSSAPFNHLKKYFITFVTNQNSVGINNVCEYAKHNIKFDTRGEIIDSKMALRLNENEAIDVVKSFKEKFAAYSFSLFKQVFNLFSNTVPTYTAEVDKLCNYIELSKYSELSEEHISKDICIKSITNYINNSDNRTNAIESVFTYFCYSTEPTIIDVIPPLRVTEFYMECSKLLSSDHILHNVHDEI